jgi:hypothetical protein
VAPGRVFQCGDHAAQDVDFLLFRPGARQQAAQRGIRRLGLAGSRKPLPIAAVRYGRPALRPLRGWRLPGTRDCRRRAGVERRQPQFVAHHLHRRRQVQRTEFGIHGHRRPAPAQTPVPRWTGPRSRCRTPAPPRRAGAGGTRHFGIAASRAHSAGVASSRRRAVSATASTVPCKAADIESTTSALASTSVAPAAMASAWAWGNSRD